MDSVFRQRLVGTLVLVALGVVFWPIIFVEPLENRPIELAPVPERPVIDTTPIPRPESPEEMIRARVPVPEFDLAEQLRADDVTLLSGDGAQQGLDSLANADAVETVSARTDAPAQPALDAAGFARGWVLQIATVSSKARAEQLVVELVDKGYPAFFIPFERESTRWWRVQIGPKLEKEGFNAMKTEVDRVLEVNSMIIRYEQPS